MFKHQLPFLKRRMYLIKTNLINQRLTKATTFYFLQVLDHHLPDRNYALLSSPPTIVQRKEKHQLFLLELVD